MSKIKQLLLLTCCLTCGCQWFSEPEDLSEPTHKLAIVESDNLFKANTTNITREFRAILDPIGKALEKEKSQYDFKIQAYVDDFGTHNQQTELSKNQAELIASYLWSKYDIPLDHLIEIAGMGSSEPIADPKTYKGRSINRRIQIILQPK